MKNRKRYIIFLNNIYSGKDNDFYLKRLRGKITVAVDGGIRFFRKNKIVPDILIGDFDSAPRLSKKYLNKIEVIQHPQKKNKTDSQLAVELVLERGAGAIEICGALSNSEIDHTLGNIFLLELINKHKKKNRDDISACIIDSEKYIFLIDDESIEIKGKPGDYISIIPIEYNCRVDFRGLVYPPPKGKLRLGNSLTLRNQFKDRQVIIKSTGKIVIVTYSER